MGMGDKERETVKRANEKIAELNAQIVKFNIARLNALIEDSLDSERFAHKIATDCAYLEQKRRVLFEAIEELKRNA